MKRFFATALLVISLFLMPWAVGFVAMFLFSAVFSWYIEIFIVGFAAGLLADIAFWKIFLILMPALFIQEYLRTHMNVSQGVIAVLWLWITGIAVFLSAFLIFV